MKTRKDDNDIFTHPFQYVAGTRPVKALDSLYNALLPWGHRFSLAPGDTYHLNEEEQGEGIILLAEGIVSICNAQTNLFIHPVFSESVIGFIDAYSLFYNVPGRHSHVLYAETAVVCYFVPLAKFVEVIDTQNLWHNVARVLAHRLMTMSFRSEALIGVESYQAIKTLLLEVWSYPQEYREKINVPRFILRRTGISRSRIMKILADLKMGGYIEIDNGKLIVLDKLPSSY